MDRHKLAFVLLAAVSAVAVSVAAFLPAYAGSNDGSDVKLECSILPAKLCAGAGSEVDPNQLQNSGFMQALVLIVRVLTIGVGILAVGAFVWAGVLYGSAHDNSSQVSQAKTIIVNTVIGILLYAGMVLIINFLVPGGLFSV